ncbi:hypothetical protein M406DRAFT_67597 [Cryphonectria parasitica EP155]|uniref:R3H domain-containing protein n=1 Tax=Cryphonectria parasitica (strain ATCC 38755 / EP155) TaxID=660469 RepID=A0A9P4YFF7_CRYP1|nr:uncharacterized protein M406DRAFT_67597 [Cryphonectria parasitica EP155]KAF3771285.1 hypothetical protein M406DRAFT_67597 [Cryphonectria parasitica EP155]
MHFLDCPAELRQAILSHLLPNEVRATGSISKPSAVLPLLLSCKTIRSDVQELCASWTPTFRVDRPQDIAGVLKTCRQGNGGPVEAAPDTIRLRLFAETKIKYSKYGNSHWFASTGETIIGPWVEAVDDCLVPKTTTTTTTTTSKAHTIKTIIIDLTPAPVWMEQDRPDWVRATVIDRRCKLLFGTCASLIAQLFAALSEKFDDEAGVTIQLGGEVGWKCRSEVDQIDALVGVDGDKRYDANELDMMKPPGWRCARTNRSVTFAGSWLRGGKDNPIHLSLPHISRRWGVPTKLGGGSSSSSINIPGSECELKRRRRLLAKKDGDGLESPHLGLDACGVLEPVDWSQDSITSYYKVAREDERAARDVLGRVLALAVESKQLCGGDSILWYDFPRAVRERRRLVHLLASDLGLASESVDEQGERFVRITL